MGLFYAPSVDKYFRYNEEDKSYSMLSPSDVGRKEKEVSYFFFTGKNNYNDFLKPVVQKIDIGKDKESGVIKREPVLMRDLEETTANREDNDSAVKEPPKKRQFISNEGYLNVIFIVDSN